MHPTTHPPVFQTPIRRRATRLRRALAIGAVVSLAAACGGDDDTLDLGDGTGEITAGDVDEEVADVTDAVDDAADEAEEDADEFADVLRDNDLTTTATAVELVDFHEITDTPEFTFFAPSDEAFTSLSSDELADLLAQPTEVAEVLRNHTIGERLSAADLTDGMELVTEAGNVLTVSVDGDTVKVGEATVVTTDVDVDDGVVHVIDALLIP